MGAALTYNWAQSYENLEGVFDIVQLKPGRLSVPFRNHGRNINSPPQTGDKAENETVGFSRRVGDNIANLDLSANN